MHILQLPTDVFIVVLSYVSGRGLVACKQVCRSFRDLLKASPQLHYKLALARAGVVDGIVGQPMEERLKLLRKLEQGWHPEDLRPRKQLRVLFSSPFTKTEVNNGFVISGMVSRTTHSYQELQVYRLPSTLPDLKAKSWKHLLLEPNIKRYKADPLQDLLVLLEIPEGHNGQSDTLLRVHLRTFAYNKRHPATSVPFLELGKFDSEHYAGLIGEGCEDFTVHIYLDILAIIVKPIGVISDDIMAHQEVLIVWQWTSGQRLAALISSPELVFSDCSFVERERLLLAHSCSSFGPSLSVLHVACGELYSKTPDVFLDVSVEPTEYEPKGYIYRLPSPPVCKVGCIDIQDIKITSGSTPYPQHYSSKQDNTTPLFVSDPSLDSAMLAFSISVALRPARYGPSPILHHTLLARTSVFSSPSPSQSVQLLPFDEWSARGIHWFLGPPGFLHGQRYAHTIFDHKYNNVEVYDFNPSHISAPISGWQTLVKTSKKSQSLSINPKMSLFKAKTPSGCSHKQYFDGGKLRSNLKYKKQTMREEFGGQASSCALDCERVIVLDTERGGYIFGFTSYNIV